MYINVGQREDLQYPKGNQGYELDNDKWTNENGAINNEYRI